MLSEESHDGPCLYSVEACGCTTGSCDSAVCLFQVWWSFITCITKSGSKLCFHTSVCLSVCEQDISKSYGWIRTFDGQVVCVTRTNWLDFGEDPDPDTRIFKVILHHWAIRPKTIYRKISQKFVDRLWQNLVDELIWWQEQANSILVQVLIQIRPISGTQNVNCSTWRRYALSRVPF